MGWGCGADRSAWREATDHYAATRTQRTPGGRSPARQRTYDTVQVESSRGLARSPRRTWRICQAVRQGGAVSVPSLPRLSNTLADRQAMRISVMLARERPANRHHLPDPAALWWTSMACVALPPPGRRKDVPQGSARVLWRHRLFGLAPFLLHSASAFAQARMASGAILEAGYDSFHHRIDQLVRLLDTPAQLPREPKELSRRAHRVIRPASSSHQRTCANGSGSTPR
jgi:hypothetical protein